MYEFITVMAIFLGVAALFNGEKVRRRLNKIERMLAWKGVLTLDETKDSNLPPEVKQDLKEWNK